MTRYHTKISVLLICLAAAPAHGVTIDGKSAEIRRAAATPTIDGVLDDAAWRDASVIEDFHQTSPVDGAIPTERTRVRVLYDDEFLYVAADMADAEPNGIRATQMIQGKLFFSDDRFWITVDSFNSKRNDYFFQVNPNGVRRDALRENNSRFIDEWDAIWQAEATIHEKGWSTEIAIPFKSLSFDPANDTWGINFGRGISRKQEFALWSSHDRQDWPAYGGEISGIRGIEQGLGLDVTPSFVLGQQRNYAAGSDTSMFEPVLDLRYRLTPSLSANLTLNTDFSTTEIDDQQVALDRFSLFFPEKRSFFLQDAGIFEFGNIDTNGRPFFSRRIGLGSDGEAVGIDAGLKVTGRIRGFNLGALAIRQEATTNADARDLLVARGSMNVLDQSALGFIVTSGDPASDISNSVVGVDFLHRSSNGPFGEVLVSNLWAQKSDTGGVDGDDLALGAFVEIPSDRLLVYARAEEIQENFNPALGFVNRTGIRRYAFGGRYRTRPETGRWRAVNHRIDATLVEAIDGGTLSQTVRLRPVTLYSHTDDFVLFEFESNREIVRNEFELFGRLPVTAGEYRFNRYRAELSTGKQRPVSAVISFQDGDFFGGTRFEKFFELQWRQSAHFSLAATFEENVVTLPGGDFTAHLAGLRTDVAFNSRWSWSNTMQYNNSAERLGVNSRLRYLPQAGREFIVVLNHNAAVDPANRFSSVESALNLKLTYTFRY